MATIKKRIRETDFSDLTEPEMSELDWQNFNDGIVLFNSGQYWESHEAWEAIWKRHTKNSRLFFQGLIQVAAGLHQLKRNIYHGVDKHFRNALWKLRPFQPICLGVDVRKLIELVEQVHIEVSRLGNENLEEFNARLLPKIKLTK